MISAAWRWKQNHNTTQHKVSRDMSSSVGRSQVGPTAIRAPAQCPMLPQYSLVIFAKPLDQPEPGVCTPPVAFVHGGVYSPVTLAQVLRSYSVIQGSLGSSSGGSIGGRSAGSSTTPHNYGARGTLSSTEMWIVAILSTILSVVASLQSHHPSIPPNPLVLVNIKERESPSSSHHHGNPILFIHSSISMTRTTT